MCVDETDMTSEEFVAGREELPDGGRWTELIAGKLNCLSPPTVEHGTAVLNLSKALAEHTQNVPGGYACFELGLVLARNPDTVHFPAVCLFTSGPMFAELDHVLTETRPAVVVEIASTSDRRRGIELRIEAYLKWGVAMVWALDPQAKHVYVAERGKPARRLLDQQSLSGGSVLPGFDVEVGRLFKEPGWAK